MPTIQWKRGDTPLPLNAGPMDLTGCEVTVHIRDRDNPDAPVTLLPATVLPGTQGDLNVSSSTIPTGKWIVEAEARKGNNFVATFPNGTDRLILHVADDLRDDDTQT